MPFKPVTDGVYILSGTVNVYLIDVPGELILIDAGFPDSAPAILGAIRDLGHRESDLKHIVLTHAHPDHIGSLAQIVKASGARTYMHAADIPIAEGGGPFRPMRAAPGLLTGLLFRLFVRPGARVEPVRIDTPVADGDVLPIAGGLEAIHVPGHCAGQIALLWPARGVLFVGDACFHLFGLGPPLGYEDRAEGERSQRRLAALNFETACFGHGKPIVGGAAAQFRKRWT